MNKDSNYNHLEIEPKWPSSAKASAGKQEYKHGLIEKRWQDVWEKNKTFTPDLKNAKNPYYNLMMFPYPSAEGLHVGNMYAFTGADVYARFNRMQGYDVFEPIGLDGFGIHSENYALKVGRNPREQAKISEKNFYRQMHSIGNSFDWTRTLETYDPLYYRWTQWLFVQMFKNGLAYRKKAEVNWCPSCKTVLSDEQVLQKVKSQNAKGKNESQSSKVIEYSGGVCERCETKVEKKNLEQWFFRITKYAQKLLDNLETLDWTEKVKIAQRNWIGRSEGARVRFTVDSSQFTAATKNDEQITDSYIEVFTTRPDTLFGATFLVLSPEHPIASQISNFQFPISNKAVEDVSKYIELSKSTSKSKTGLADEVLTKSGVFTGLYAINPVNNEKIPVWVADYVLMGYGTGAIMAVPAHDDRDFEFAKKYNLSIKQVIMPENGVKREDEERRDGGAGIIFDPKRQKYAVALWPERNNFLGLFAGGVEDKEDEEEGVLREITEESGLYNFKHVEKLGDAFAHYYSGGRKVNRVAKASGFLIILENDEVKDVHLEDHEKFTLVWKDPEEILQNWKEYDKEQGLDHWVRFLRDGVARAIELGYDTVSDRNTYKLESYTGDGIITNSGEWDGLEVPKEIGKVLDWLEKKGIGEREVNYHLRDWLISRQRYWGPPIPMVFCDKCASEGKSWFDTKEAKEIQDSRFKIHESSFLNHESQMNGWFPVPEDQLPVLLPDVEDWKPLGTVSTGSGQAKGPLANHPEFYKTKCPNCGKDATRETDVSDTFLDSAWYFFRYTSVENQKSKIKSQKLEENGKNDIESAPFDIEIVKKWLPVDIYIGGAEHSVLHLLYSRFITSFLADLKLIAFDEPYKKFFAHGLIIKDGAKMSKSRGNVVVPDEYIKKYGADTLRLYLMFIGPFSQGGDFRDSGIEGMNRFVRRVWKLLSGDLNSGVPAQDHLKIMHKTIKAVSEDVKDFSYNTAIARLMEWYNFLSEKAVKEAISLDEAKTFIKLIAPFAPHMAEELWQTMKQESRSKKQEEVKKNHNSEFVIHDSVHVQTWPEFEEKYLVEDEVVVIVQVNGKKRGELTINKEQLTMSKEIEEKAREAGAKHLEGKEIRKVIYVTGKIINFVI